jgi:hypothetical protein
MVFDKKKENHQKEREKREFQNPYLIFILRIRIITRTE